MKDLTKGPITPHIVKLAAPLAIGMLAQVAYQLVDLYFLSRIGASATAGVNAAGSAIFVVSAGTQVLAVGTAALVAHAVGRNDRHDASLLLNQALALAATCGAATIVLLWLLGRPYLHAVAADAATADAGMEFLTWVAPGFALLFPMTTVAAALRGTGIVRQPIVLYMLSIVLNALLAPVLIAGWGTGVPLGAAGAGLATTSSIAVGMALLGFYCARGQRYLTFDVARMQPRLAQWRRILAMGLPAGGELVLTFASISAAYYAIRDFGASAQAGFGVGIRVVQTLLLPAMSIGFAAGPITGQNLGAGNSARVLETYRKTLLISTALMAATTLLVQVQPEMLVQIFGTDAATLAAAVAFLQITSWSFVAQGIVYTCSTVLQGLGNTLPALLSSLIRFVTFAAPAYWLSAQVCLRPDDVWYLWVGSLALQAIVSLWLLRAELHRKLPAFSKWPWENARARRS